jgi:hypothetical protein
MSHQKQIETNDDDDSLTRGKAQKTEECDSMTSAFSLKETAAAAAAVALSNKDKAEEQQQQPLEEVEKVLTYLARKNSLSGAHANAPNGQAAAATAAINGAASVSAIVAASEFSSLIFNNTSFTTNDMALVEDTIEAEKKVTSEDNEEESKVKDDTDDAHTSKDFELSSELNNTAMVMAVVELAKEVAAAAAVVTSRKSSVDLTSTSSESNVNNNNSMTFVTREAMEVEDKVESLSVESDSSLDAYMSQFQATRAASLFQPKDLSYEEPVPPSRGHLSQLSSPSMTTDQVVTVVDNVVPVYKEEVTEITVRVSEEEPISNRFNRRSSSSQLSAVLYIKERKSKHAKKPSILVPTSSSLLYAPLATSTMVVRESSRKNSARSVHSGANIGTFSNEYLNSPLQKSETRWFVYPINAKNSSIHEEEKETKKKVKDEKQSARKNASPKTSIVSNKKSRSIASPFSAIDYANQFKTKSKVYEAADEDYFVEKQPGNNYDISHAFDARPIKIVKHLGVTNADPEEYRKLYAKDLVSSQELPLFLNRIQPPAGITLASNWRLPKDYVHELEGDVHALNLIDLDKEGLSEYRDYLVNKNIHKMTH